MRLRFMVVALLFCLVSSSPAQEKLREEEIIVRTAYAKLSYSDEVRIVLDALQNTGRDKLWTTRANLVDRALDSRLNFELDHFQFGKISAIADRKMAEFDGSPTAIGGEVLDVTPSVYNYSANGSPSKYVAYVKFAWKPSPYPALWPAENWPISRALQAEQFEGKKYTDYVTYTVTVSFQHKSRTYDAWMLFGRDDKSKPQVYFMDGVADPTAVTFALSIPCIPQHSWKAICAPCLLSTNGFMTMRGRAMPKVKKIMTGLTYAAIRRADAAAWPSLPWLRATHKRRFPPEKNPGSCRPVSTSHRSSSIHKGSLPIRFTI